MGYLFGAINFCNLFYNFNQTKNNLTLKKVGMTYNLKWRE